MTTGIYKGNHPIHLYSTSSSYNYKYVTSIVNEGLYVDFATPTGATPLHISCRTNKSIDLIRFLLINGADPNKKIESGIDVGKTPLNVIFLNKKNREVCNDGANILLSAGAKVDIFGKNCVSVLHTACKNDNVDPETIEKLLEHGAYKFIFQKTKGQKDKSSPYQYVMNNCFTKKRYVIIKDIFNRYIMQYGLTPPIRNITNPNMKNSKNSLNINMSTSPVSYTSISEDIDLESVISSLSSFSI